MKKLEIIQIMNLAEKLNQLEWINVLIGLNNTGKTEEFFQMINQKDLLTEILQDTKKQHSR